jgi:hypothetical protein
VLKLKQDLTAWEVQKFAPMAHAVQIQDGDIL